MRIIALDVHRSSAQVAILETGKVRDAGKIDLERGRLLQFAKKLKSDDEIVIEATGDIDAAVLAKLHASGFLPEVWMPDEETEMRRRVVAERTQLVSQLTRLNNRIQSILHAYLIPPYKGVLFSKRGRAWLDAVILAP